jgi:CspA family cold shock protein
MRSGEDHGLDGRTVWCDGSVRSAKKSKAGSVVQGKVKFFDQNRGFGFISREGGEDVFVHVSNLESNGTSLAEGQTVEFEIGPGRKSEEAKNVRTV